MSDRVQASGGAGIAGDEGQLSFLRTSFGPLEIALRMHWLIVFINAHQGHVDVETRKVKVVRIAAKKCRLKFRHENEPNISVLFVAIKIVLSALVKRDYVRAKPGGFG